MNQSNLFLAFEKIMLGITLAAPIGPVSIEMINRGLKNGFWSAFNIRLGAAIGNILCLIVTYLGLSQIIDNPRILNVFGLLGSMLLLYMGISTFIKSNKIVDLSSPVSKHNGLLLGLYLAIFNPVALVFWTGIFAVSISTVGVSAANFIFDLFVIVGVLIWGVGFCLILAFCHSILNKKTINILTKIAALLMIFFGIKYAYCVGVRFLAYA